MVETREDRRRCAQRRRAVPPPVAPAHRDSPPIPPVQLPPPPPSISHPQLTVCAATPFEQSLAAVGRLSTNKCRLIPGAIEDEVRAPRMPRVNACMPSPGLVIPLSPLASSRKRPISTSVHQTLTRCRSPPRRIDARFEGFARRSARNGQSLLPAIQRRGARELEPTSLSPAPLSL